ncbi:uncharacterized protein LOC135845096 [Planococcus citri]|uniref:uncharacterized protein LOC135845096 n=1 Tax=Planococcus citri TaxID=170843 RepID=UPI0031F7C8AF
MVPRTIFFSIFIIQWQKIAVKSDEDFAQLARSEYFIDKSDMIKVFFNPSKASYHFITCPPGFGKSTNLQMLKLFANIVVDKNGSEVSYTKTQAFQVFGNLRIVKLHESGDFIERHMTQYPIVHLELATNKSILEISSEYDIVSYLNERLASCFKDYEWLLEIPREQFIRNKKKMGLQEISFLEKLRDRNLSKTDAVDGLYSLCRIVSLYFDRKVIVLVDQYDHMINSYAIWTSNRTVSKIYSAINTMLALALGDQRFVQNWMLLGTSSMPFRGSYLTFSDFNHHSFLNEHLFTPYFGFTELEMRQLFRKFKCSMEEKIDIQEYYNGYVTRGTKTPMYNPASVTKYFSTRISVGRKHMSSALKSYWSTRDEKEFLLRLLKNLPGFKTDLKKLISRDSISFKLTKNFFKKDLRVFRDLNITNKHFYIKHYNLAMSFLFEHGYLVPSLLVGERVNDYKVPNNEIAIELDAVLEEFKAKKSKTSIGLDYSLPDLSLYEDDDSTLEQKSHQGAVNELYNEFLSLNMSRKFCLSGPNTGC